MVEARLLIKYGCAVTPCGEPRDASPPTVCQGFTVNSDFNIIFLSPILASSAYTVLQNLYTPPRKDSLTLPSILLSDGISFPIKMEPMSL